MFSNEKRWCNSKWLVILTLQIFFLSLCLLPFFSLSFVVYSVRIFTFYSLFQTSTLGTRNHLASSFWATGLKVSQAYKADFLFCFWFWDGMKESFFLPLTSQWVSSGAVSKSTNLHKKWWKRHVLRRRQWSWNWVIDGREEKKMILTDKSKMESHETTQL